MATSYTGNKNLGKPASGSLNWDVPINSDMDSIDSAFGGVTSKSVTGVTTTQNLTISEVQKLTITFSGTLSQNLIYTIPAPASVTGLPIAGGNWIVDVSTVVSGAGGPYTITISPVTGGGTSIVLTLGYIYNVYSNGTNIQYTDTRPVTPAANSVNTAAIQNGAVTYPKIDPASIAAAADFRANVASHVLDTTGTWGAAAFVTLVDAATIAVDMSTGLNFQVTLTGNRTLGNPTNTKVGQSGAIVVNQDATGGRTLAFGSAYKFANGVAPTMSTAANSVDILFYYVYTSSFILISTFRGVA
jgi:hypothetical protein